MDLSWMPRFCDPDHVTPAARHPVTVEVDGLSWAVTTDGRVLVAVREDTPSGFPAATPEDSERLNVLLRHGTGSGHPADLAALRAWAEPPQWPGDAPCDACQGAGTASCSCCKGTGTRICECVSCGDEHDAECEDCGGDKVETCGVCEGTGHTDGRLPVRPGRIGPVVINREDLARALGELPGDTVTLSATGPTDPLYATGPGWCVAVMPLRLYADAETPTWPLST